MTNEEGHEDRPRTVREINLSGLNSSVHLMSTSPDEDIVFLLEKGLSALAHIKKDMQ